MGSPSIVGSLEHRSVCWREGWGTALLCEGVEVGLSRASGADGRREAREVGCRGFVPLLG